jgi:type IV pili sensor histidine kinase/response regulator
MRKLLIVTLLSVLNFQAVASETQIGRYTSEVSKPSFAQKNLLATQLDVKFSKNIVTVKEAVEYLLEPSGYRLAIGQGLDPDIRLLYRQILPQVHRRLSSISLADALQVIATDVWMLQTNPVLRTVTFRLNDEVRARYVVLEDKYEN